jgi:iron complex transport system substrate-binding protein
MKAFNDAILIGMDNFLDFFLFFSLLEAIWSGTPLSLRGNPFFLSKSVMKYLNSFLFVIMLTGLLMNPTVQTEAKVVMDQLGRQVRVPNDPQRVVALAPNITEIIFALEQEHRLVGVTRFSDYPPEAAHLTKVGSYVHLDIERIVSLKPDLCIAIKDGNPKIVAQRLESLKVPVFAVDPKRLDTIMKTIVDIGELLNADDIANGLVEDMTSRIQHVKSLVNQTEHRPKVFFQIGISPIVSVGTPTFIHELIVLAGGINLAAGRVSYPRFSREQVLALSPDVIIITSMARAAVFEKVKAEWNRWSNLPAVKNGRIFLEDSNLFDRPTPRLVSGLELLVRLIHPELFKGVE